MDSITQAVLGAAIGKVCLGNKLGNKAIWIGAAIATIPDLDVITLPFLDPLQRLSMHRGYSHSILFCVLLALLLSYLLQRMKMFESLSFSRLLIFHWLALSTHILLDGFTSYGTLLFLPFSDCRFGFDSINVIDPIYTLPLLIGVLVSAFSKNKSWIVQHSNSLGIAISCIYLATTLVIKNDVADRFEKAINSQNIQITKLHSQPVGIGSLHWFGLGHTQYGFYMGDYSYNNPKEIELTFFPNSDSLLLKLDDYTVDRMKWFAKDFYHVVEQGDSLFFYNMQVDMQGIYDLDNRKAPTRGYFILENKDGGKLIGSGRH